MLTVLTHSFPTRLSSDLLERYFLDLPLNGSRSRHSLRAHGYDVLVWVRFLASARGKSVWQADADDVGAYHRARRRSDAEFRISASTWNRAIASLDKLYRWAERGGRIARPPFTLRYRKTFVEG